MRVPGWSLVRFLHVLAAMGWVGGQLLLSLVVLPVLREAAGPAVRGPLIRKTAKRFGAVANGVLLPTLLVTGLALASHRGVTIGSLDDPGYGRLLGTKLVLVLVSVVLAAIHGIVAMSRPGAARLLAVSGLLSSIGIVVFATALVP
jgi:putative copper export protein